MRAELLPVVIPFPIGAARTPGIHESGLIRALAVEYGILNRQWVPEDFDLLDITEDGTDDGEWWASLDEDSRVRMAIGMAFEEWYVPRLPHIHYQPGEICLNGIYLTPDGESRGLLLSEYDRQSGYVIAGHEVKTTSKSINTTGDLMVPNPKNWMWLMQVKGMAKALGTCLMYLHVLYLYGDYSRPFRAKLHLWRIEFDQQEIDDAWDLLLDSLSRYRQQGRIQAPLSPLQVAALLCRRRLRQQASSLQSKRVML